MKYLVMECNLSYAVVLDEQGRFKKVANMNYKVGQTITDIVEMQPKPERKTVNLRVISSIAAVAACLMLMISSLFYLMRTPYASVYISINPSVRIDVNENDTAIGLKGINEDGEKLVDGYSYKNKKLDLVIDELMDRAIAYGYLSSGKTITLTLDSEHNEWEIAASEKLEQHLEEYLSEKISVIIEVETKHNGTPTTPKPTAEPMDPIVIPIDPKPTEPATEEIPTSMPTPTLTETPTPTPTKAPTPTREPVDNGDSEYGDTNGESDYRDDNDIDDGDDIGDDNDDIDDDDIDDDVNDGGSNYYTDD